MNCYIIVYSKMSENVISQWLRTCEIMSFTDNATDKQKSCEMCLLSHMTKKKSKSPLFITWNQQNKVFIGIMNHPIIFLVLRPYIPLSWLTACWTRWVSDMRLYLNVPSDKYRTHPNVISNKLGIIVRLRGLCSGYSAAVA